MPPFELTNDGTEKRDRLFRCPLNRTARIVAADHFATPTADGKQMPRVKSGRAQVPRSELLRERAINCKRLATAVVNEFFAMRLRELAEKYEGKTERLDESANR